MLGACCSVRDQFEREERNEYMTKIMLCVFLFLCWSWSVRVCVCAYTHTHTHTACGVLDVSPGVETGHLSSPEESRRTEALAYTYAVYVDKLHMHIYIYIKVL